MSVSVTVFGYGTRLLVMVMDGMLRSHQSTKGGKFRSAGATIAATKPQRVTRNKRSSTGGPRQVGDVVRARARHWLSQSRCGRAKNASRPSDTKKQHAISAISTCFTARPDSAGRRRCFGTWLETRPKGSVDVRGLTSSDIDPFPMAQAVRRATGEAP